MIDDASIAELQRAGINTINREGQHDHPLIQLQQDNVVFQQMFEYPVADFEAEVGFFVTVFGLSVEALTTDYALFKHPQQGFCFSFKRAASMPSPATIGLKLLFMTTNIPIANDHLEQTGLVTNREFRSGSQVQQVIHFTSPNGVAIEIWEMPTQ